MLCSGRNVTAWVETGEYQPSIFFNLEKRNYYKNTTSEFHLQEESTTCNEKEILDQIEAYFKNLTVPIQKCSLSVGIT